MIFRTSGALKSAGCGLAGTILAPPRMTLAAVIITAPPMGESSLPKWPRTFPRHRPEPTAPAPVLPPTGESHLRYPLMQWRRMGPRNGASARSDQWDSESKGDRGGDEKQQENESLRRRMRRGQ